MNSKVSQIIRHCNVDENNKLKVLVYPFDLETEIEISKTGHLFYRLNFGNEVTKDLPENFILLGKNQIPMFLDYDIFMFYNDDIDQSVFTKIMQTLRTPFLMIDESSPDDYNNREVIITNLANPQEENFVEKWKEVFAKYYKENKI